MLIILEAKHFMELERIFLLNLIKMRALNPSWYTEMKWQLPSNILKSFQSFCVVLWRFIKEVVLCAAQRRAM